MIARLLPICTQHPTLTLHNHLGEILNVQQLPQKVFGSNSFNGRRGEIHDVLLEHAKELGVEIKFGYEVVKFWEDSVTGKAGVVARARGGNCDGEEVTFEGDVVVGADGVRSRARATVLVCCLLHCKIYHFAHTLCTGIRRKTQTFWIRHLPRVV